MLDTDVVIIGAGFAGSLTALALRSRGVRVAIIERGRHPRFAIGESTTPLTNLLLEELADTYALPQIRPFSKWATWQAHRPDVAVGLKRGFTFLFHEEGHRFAPTTERERELLVAASPNDDVADTHWYRPEFDAALAEYARQAGAEYLDQTRIESVRQEHDGVRLDATRNGRAISVRGSFAIDASGPRGCLVQHLGDGGAAPEWMPPTAGLYTHFTNVGLWERTVPPGGQPPYPPDTAALHHIFPGGWIWVLRFNNDITSAGAVLTDALAARVGLEEGRAAWHRLLARLPSVADHFGGSRDILPFAYAPRVTFRTRTVVGSNWALLPSAAGVIDPLLSTGFPLTLLGIGRLVGILTESAPDAARDKALSSYAAMTEAELDVTEQLVAALYASMDDPALFRQLALLYFAAASFSEAARRLGRAHLAPGFLLSAHPTFAPALGGIARIARSRPTGAARQALFDRIARTIEPFDTAGLLDSRRRGWYPVLADDLIGSAGKLDATTEDVQRLIEKTFGLSSRSSGRP